MLLPLNQTLSPLGRGGVIAATPSPTYLLREDFENPGMPPGWANTGAPNWDYTTLPLVGSKSWFSGNSISNTSLYDFGSDEAALDIFCAVRMTANTSSQGWPLVFLVDGGNNFLAGLVARTDVTTRIQHGVPTSANQPGIVGVTRFVWMHYERSTNGSNGRLELFMSTDETKPQTPNAVLTNGSATNHARKLRLSGVAGSGSGLIVDKLRVSRDLIGSNPP